MADSASIYGPSSVPLDASHRFIGTWEKKLYLKEISSAVVQPEDPVPEYLNPLEEIMRVLNVDFDHTTEDIKCCLRMRLPDSLSVEEEVNLKNSITKEIQPIQMLLKLLITKYFEERRDDPFLQTRKQVHLILNELRKKAYFLAYLNHPHIERLLEVKKDGQCPKCSKIEPLLESEKYYDLERKDINLHMYVQTVFYKLGRDNLQFYNEYPLRLMRQFNMSYDYSSEELKCCLRQALLEGDETDLAEFLMRKIEALRQRLKPLIFDALFINNYLSPLAKEVQMILEGIRKNTDFLILLGENNIMAGTSGQSNDSSCSKCQGFDRPPSAEVVLVDSLFPVNATTPSKDEKKNNDNVNSGSSDILDDSIVLLQEKTQYLSIEHAVLFVLLALLLFVACFQVVYQIIFLRNKRLSRVEYELPITNYRRNSMANM
ncbi:hypothetical protein QYM36_000950 [Artemia franciscana]|uniref:Uncharacterized protein n=1 Tax=Artemia franciscana TaxID=6661 RepID=A0AA88LF39_ARTSF|nr:hypothetical protein QYM36_000950 [Artemia franciscana]